MESKQSQKKTEQPKKETKLKPKRKKSKEKSAHYVPAKDFVKAIQEFYAKPGEAEIGEQLGIYIYKIDTDLLGLNIYFFS